MRARDRARVVTPSLDEWRSLWRVYAAGDWIAVAYWLREWDAALWDLDGVSSGCSFLSEGKQ